MLPTRQVLCILLFFALSFTAKGQTGNYYLSNFTPSDYGGSDQNWCSVQDKWGRIYVANGNGVLLYDGKNWKVISLHKKSRCFSLDIDSIGRIFVGGEDEFGYLNVSKNGEILYRSISQFLPESDTIVGNVWATYCINNEVFFGSNQKLFCYKNEKITTFTPDSSAFHTFFKVGNSLFVREKQVGFKVYVDGLLKKVKGTENFADLRVDFILPYKDNIYWVGTRNDGMYHMLYDPEAPQRSAFSKIKTPSDEWMLSYRLYSGAKINDNMYAMGSLKGGVLLVDKNFNPITKINYEKGLLDDGIKNIFVDCNQNMWLSMNFGVAFVELNTPITRWTKNNGIKGVVEASVKFNNKLYIATDRGLQVLDENKNKFIETEIGDKSFALLVKNNELLIGTEVGLYSMMNGHSKLLYDHSVYSLYIDTNYTTVIYLGTDEGLVIGNYLNGKFIPEKIFNDWGEVRSITSNTEGVLGFGTSSSGVYILKPGKLYEYKRITEKEGLPGLNENYVFNYQGKILIATDKGFYKIENFSNPACIKADEINSHLLASAGHTVWRASQVNDEIWYQYTTVNENQVLKDVLTSVSHHDTKLEEDPKMLQRIKGVNAKSFFHDSNRVYISTNEGLYCYDIGFTPKQNPFYTFISSLKLKNDSSEVILNLTDGTQHDATNIPFRSNEIHVIPAASDYYDINDLRFSYYLEGKEDNFGAWSKIPVIIYNNLHEGDYILHVKSKNILGQEGKEISLSFTVLPPWYRSIWAFLIYAVATITLIWLIVKLNSRRLIAQNIRLEHTITERTKTIVSQKAEIEIKNQEITDSINYAKRIQQAILPSIKEMKNTWKDLFIFFQPKDIVSGDFYWYHKISDHEFLIAAADCTGHGVPGGFMSMICSDKLNEAVNFTKIPSEILHHANNAIKFALKGGEQETETKDGMEILLLRVNTKTHHVSFAGANLSLLIVKKGSDILENIRSTKASVGSNTAHNFQYQLFDLQLSAGDHIYVSSDGYPDQFGGPQGKKFLSKNFKKYVLSLKNDPIEKQNQLLKDNINNWMHGYDQVDDLLVIGIKL